VGLPQALRVSKSIKLKKNDFFILLGLLG